MLAEVEMASEDTVVPCPAWLGADVSQDFRYANSNLAKLESPPA